MKLVKQTLIATAVSAAMLSGASHAGAIGTGYLSIEDLVITNDSGAVLVLGTDIAPAGTGLYNVGDTLADLDGTSQAFKFPEPIDQPPIASDVLGQGFSCVGACTYVNNAFTFLTKPADVADSYVVSDVVIEGALVAGVPDGNGGFLPVGASAEALAESAVVPNSDGSAQGNVGTSSSFQFIANYDGDLTFSGVYDAYLRAALIGDIDGVTANAEIGWTITLEDFTNGGLFSYDLSSDDEWVRSTISNNFPGTDVDAAFGGDFSASTEGGFISQNSLYQLTITHTALADSQAVNIPVPGPLALMGAGLVLIGGLRLRRNRAV